MKCGGYSSSSVSVAAWTLCVSITGSVCVGVSIHVHRTSSGARLQARKLAQAKPSGAYCRGQRRAEQQLGEFDC